MNNPKPFQKRIAIVLLAIFIPSLLPVNMLYASNNGPVAPEATAFEPVDATDMVNLVTGDMSYVLPLLNVPSPEGGYPLALSYHAGIAMDQEASWVGLGWNLNPGAINRNVNGVADDAYNNKIVNFVYSDLGSHSSVNIGVGFKYSIFSTGLEYSFVDGRGTGGIVSFGLMLDRGIGADYNVGFGDYANKSSASFYLNGFGLNKSNNSIGFSYNSYFSTGANIKNKSNDFSLRGASNFIRIGDSSIGFNTGSYNSPNNVATITKSFHAGIPITKAFAVRLGYSKANYSMFNSQTDNTNGALYLKNSYRIYDYLKNENYRNEIMDANEESLTIKSPIDGRNYITINTPHPTYDNFSVNGQGIGMNIQPLVLDSKSLVMRTEKNDPYNTSTSAQMGFMEKYNVGDQFVNSFMNDNNALNNKIHFYDINSPTSFIDNSLSTWDYNNNISKITDISNIESQNYQFLDNNLNVGFDVIKNRLKKDSYVEAYTNEQIANNTNLIIDSKGLERSALSSMVPKGIGAFKITTNDGKTYHYSNPVYHYEMITKNFNSNKPEDNEFVDKISTQPYATHWLLTAITGSDYFDYNQNGNVDKDDFGYWVEFEYGKWTDSYLWKRESLNKTFLNYSERQRASCNTEEHRKSSSRIIGIKEIYYLNSVNTRTHSALFLKSEKNDDLGNSIIKSKQFNNVDTSIFYNSNYSTGVYSTQTNYNYNYNIKGNFKTLKLDKIVLIPIEEKINFTLNYGQASTSQQLSYININSTAQLSNAIGQDLGSVNSVIHQRTWYGGKFLTNVYLTNQLDEDLVNQKALKKIEFNYTLSNKFFLNSVTEIGKNNIQSIPPHRFEYYNFRNYSQENYDLWGYDKLYPHNYSLKKIIVPIGANIQIEYERDDFSNVIQNSSITQNQIKPIAKKFSRLNNGFSGVFEMKWLNPCFLINQIYPCAKVGEVINVEFRKNANMFTVQATITNIDSQNNIYVSFNQQVPDMYVGDFYCCSNGHGSTQNCSYYVDLQFSCNIDNEMIGKCDDSRGGLRVKNIKVTDNNSVYKTNYDYNIPGTNISSGITPATPYVENPLTKFFNNGVIYKNVKVSTQDINNNTLGINQYDFNVYSPNINVQMTGGIRETSTGQNATISVTYGDFIKINATQRTREVDVTADNYGSNSFLAWTSIGEAELIDNTSKIGELVSKRELNAKNQVVSKLDLKYNNPFEDSYGTISESFESYKTKIGIPGLSPGGQIVGSTYYNYFVNSFKKKKIASILVSKEITSNNYSKTINYDKYDFLTGQVLETTLTTSDGKAFKSRLVPAYTKYPQMGSKVDDINNRNMLSQTAATYSYIQDAGEWKVTGVGITTWNNNWSYQDIAGINTSPTVNKEKIWRKHKTYTWNGETNTSGIFLNYDNSNGNDDGFVWGVGQPQTNLKWKQLSEVTLYDHYSMPLEVKDINGNKASTKMDVFNEKIEAIGNAAYNEMYYTGGEIMKDDWGGQEIKMINVRRNVNLVHSGKYSVASRNDSDFGVLMKNGHRPGKYKLTVWIHSNNFLNAKLTDNSGNFVPFNENETKKAGEWYLKTAYLNVTAGEYSIKLSSFDSNWVFYDDLMIRPLASSITGYVYNEYDELTHIVNNNGLATRFEYDSAGRLIKSYIEIVDDASNGITGGFKLSSENRYNYKNMN